MSFCNDHHSFKAAYRKSANDPTRNLTMIASHLSSRCTPVARQKATKYAVQLDCTDQDRQKYKCKYNLASHPAIVKVQATSANKEAPWLCKSSRCVHLTADAHWAPYEAHVHVTNSITGPGHCK